MKKYARHKYNGVVLGYAGHIEPKMISHIEFFSSKGAKILLAPAVPGIADEWSYNYLRKKGVLTFGTKARSWEELEKEYARLLRYKPNFIFEMGGRLTKLAMEKGILLNSASEVTGTGVHIARTHSPAFPWFTWDEVGYKGIHNRYEVAYGVWYGFRYLTNLELCRKNVAVVGFGPIGQGVAQAARSMGASVVVCEIDSLRRMQAKSEGFWTDDLEHAAKCADVIITCTGVQKVLDITKIPNFKDGVILCNAGHDDREICRDNLPRGKVLFNGIEASRIKNKNVFILNGGRLLNLASHYGSAINTFDVMTAYFVEILHFMFTKSQTYPAGVQSGPREISRRIEKC